MLTANSFAELADLDMLGTFAYLTHLILLENPVTRKEVRVFFLAWVWYLVLAEVRYMSGARTDTQGCVELSALDPVAMSFGEISGLSESQGRGTQEG